jgi:Mg2+/Co2+ transporter CorB
VMQHRRDIFLIDASLPTSQIVEEALVSPFTRIPLWRDTPDNIIGVMHAKAMLREVHAHTGDLDALDLDKIATPPWFIPESTTLLDQLHAFRRRREHFALVVDEYGALMGVVTLEDILEEIVGDISDEHDVVPIGVRPQRDGSYLVSGGVTVRDLNRRFGWVLPDQEAATIAGLVIHESKVIPQVGQIFHFHGFRFEIVRRQRNRITSIRMAKMGEISEETAAE